MEEPQFTHYIYIRAVKRWIVWLSRITHCRGFGIQSPTDYHFVCNVINDKRHYEQYSTLLQNGTHRDADTLRLLRLYFRLSRHFKPFRYIDFTLSADESVDYVKSGSPDTVVITAKDHDESDLLAAIKSHDDRTKTIQTPTETMVCASAKTTPQATILSIIGNCKSHDVIIIEHIKHDKKARMTWQKIVDDARATITFDLYYCGIVILNTSRYKQNYIINF